MKTKEMVVTPEMAQRWLALNTRNRVVRSSHVDFLACEIENNRWQLTHQGIALNGDTLIDGQHRLLAIVKARKPVSCLVTTEAALEMQDAIDVGARRSVADQIHLADGMTNANLTCAAYREVALICVGQNIKLSIGITRGLVSELGREMDLVMGSVDKFKPAKTGWVVGTLAFALYADPDSLNFIDPFYSGLNLTSGSPAKAARDWLTNRSSFMLTCTDGRPRRDALLNAVKNAICGIKVNKMTHAPGAPEYFIGKKRKFVNELRAEFSAQIKNAR